jgi:hypothetical protein
MKFSCFTAVFTFAFHPYPTSSFPSVGFQLHQSSSARKRPIPTSSLPSSSKQQEHSNHHDEFDNLQHALGVFAIAASIVLCNPAISVAGVYPTGSSNISGISSAGSSTIQIAEAIKVLDMSLPSYGDIASPKASLDAIKGVEPEKESTTTATSVLPAKKTAGSKKTKPDKKSKVMISESVENAADSSKNDKKEQDSMKYVDMSMPSYSESATVTKKGMFAL